MNDRIPPRRHLIACGVLAADLKHIVGERGLAATLEFLPGALHRQPLMLRARLQEAIDRASERGAADLICVGYGVCGLGTVGLQARAVPLALPRIHDCISLFLGSDAAYRAQFARYPGTYYISAGWVDDKEGPAVPAAEGDAPASPLDFSFEQFVEAHGAENAEAVRHFLDSWRRNYQRAAFVDTGLPGPRRRYADIARRMAADHGWAYEELRGTHDLLARLLAAESTTAEILVVPPGQVTTYDGAASRLAAAPVEDASPAEPAAPRTVVLDLGADADRPAGRTASVGLGIDAGGTYTDAVIFDFASGAVLEKSKALTTKWDFTLGITEALDRLSPARLARVDLASVSTTLATNAIVEGRGQKVGLILMPPYGRLDPGRFRHEPIAQVRGQLEIDGREIEPVDPADVAQAVGRMMDREQVGAFAVAGYASHCNPRHELDIKEIVERQSGLTVTCGHDISDGLNYRIRAETAALNARIIPCLKAFLDDVRVALRRRGVRAPVMVVRSDGTLMSVDSALKRPIETILSGPAASVAGAQHLTRLRDALVVDVGGTTTDTALIRGGAVRTCEDGARVGGWKTHVRALEVRTVGLGGDSRIVWRQGAFEIGPHRVAPVCWCCSRSPAAREALDWLDPRLDQFRAGSADMDLLMAHDAPAPPDLTAGEQEVLARLARRPHSAHELTARTGSLASLFLPLGRLEERNIVQRCGLTPTDVLHATGEIRLWDADAARRICGMFARLAGRRVEDLLEELLDRFVDKLAWELVKRQIADDLDPDEIEASPAAMTLMHKALGKTSSRYRIAVSLKDPVIGIGAPVACFLPRAAARVGAEAVIPEHADVANAIGAITSSVCVQKEVHISVNELGVYTLGGLPGAPVFSSLEQAQSFAMDALRDLVRQRAREAGSNSPRIEIVTHDHAAPLSDGRQLFVGRTIKAVMRGAPDLAALAAES